MIRGPLPRLPQPAKETGEWARSGNPARFSIHTTFPWKSLWKTPDGARIRSGGAFCPVMRCFFCCLLGLAAVLEAGEAPFSGAGPRYREPYPAAASKKGLQVEMSADALELGVKHAALNLDITSLHPRDGGGEVVEYANEDGRFAFRRTCLESMDRRIKPLSDAGVLVNLIVLAYSSGIPAVDAVVLHPRRDPAAPNRLAAFNTVTPEGRAWFKACMEFLAERWSNPGRRHGRVAGYIIGNEVNSHWWWCNMGLVRMDGFVEDHLRTVRTARDAVRRQASWPRIYLSLDQHWNMRSPAGTEQHGFPARAFLERFAAESRKNGDFDWNLAFHPYPEDLFKPDFWNDRSATPDPDATPRVTFKNLEALTAFMGRPEMLHEGRRRHIILSEQGFHTPPGGEGERLQAAAYCLAYRIVDAMPEIDAFILHRHVDHRAEGGLLLGLRRNEADERETHPAKLILECFRKADTPEWREAFQFALPIVGRQKWPGDP